jgi:hypothetical protein
MKLAGILLAFVLVLGLGPVKRAEAQSRIESRNRDTEFVGWVEPDKLYWRPFVISGLPDASFKLLSFAESNGARSQITRLPAGWSHPAGYHHANEEIFVLDGDLSIGGKKMTKYSYAYYPAGYSHGEAYSEHGATLLHWWDGDPDFVASQESRPDTRLDETVEDWNYYDAPWTSEEDFPRWADELPPPDLMYLKLMRMDKRTGAMTWMNYAAGGGVNPGPVSWEVHPSWEESMLLEGDMTYGECLPEGEIVGTYKAGGYFFRPADILHGGPSSHSDSYMLFIFRTGAPIWADFHAECDTGKAGSEK